MKKLFYKILAIIVIGYIGIFILPYLRIVKVKTTAYCSCKKCCENFSDGMTSTGRNARETMGVATDPKVFDYGDWIYIPKIGWREVDDTGGAMRQATKKGIKHIDIRMRNHRDALEYGSKTGYVIVWLRKQKNVKIVVEKGESLSIIATRINVPWPRLAKLNNLDYPYIIHPGQVLKVPAK